LSFRVFKILVHCGKALTLVMHGHGLVFSDLDTYLTDPILNRETPKDTTVGRAQVLTLQ
jgi:hypothetical protein